MPMPQSFEQTRVALTVEESRHFTLGTDKDDVWHSATPRYNLGYVHLGPENRSFALSMVHEMHCLWILNRVFSSPGNPDRIPHARHCIGYLRHGVLCDADLTLEPGDFFERDFGEETARVGETHECRDWSAVYDAAEKNWYEKIAPFRDGEAED
ncbi:hypothetical protein EXIGLDRAFT_699029 [Exidia glandulosa HHB12029]|uniref:Uncharacterized protein n=1 Tax=Exidia glandulosa HHB12029 TaxID=1314781 RepID=A0A165DZD2_EXIGL|nr:hypothetical protein EXIGLDRAFT_699029 [Exidia glandulosa HHB12029]